MGADAGCGVASCRRGIGCRAGGVRSTSAAPAAAGGGDGMAATMAAIPSARCRCPYAGKWCGVETESRPWMAATKSSGPGHGWRGDGGGSGGVLPPDARTSLKVGGRGSASEGNAAVVLWHGCHVLSSSAVESMISSRRPRTTAVRRSRIPRRYRRAAGASADAGIGAGLDPRGAIAALTGARTDARHAARTSVRRVYPRDKGLGRHPVNAGR